jgi:pimeloyl-ACP methyl ester carboxylesterase
MDRHMFDHQVDALSDYRAILWDVPAHGESRPWANFSLDSARNALLGILDRERAGAVHLVGQSMGGYIAQDLIRVAPERALSFVSIGSTPFGARYYSGFDRWGLRNAAALMALYPYRLLCSSIAGRSTATDASREYAARAVGQLTKPELLGIVDPVYRGFLERDEPLSFPCPVLLCLGEHDATGKVNRYTEAWARDIGVEPVVIPDAAHNANVDNPDAVNSVLVRFLAGVEKG